MRNIKVLILLSVSIYFGCNSNKLSTVLDKETDRLEVTTKDKSEIKLLISQMLKWSESKNNGYLLPTLEDSNDIFIDFDFVKLDSILIELKETNLFTSEFIENYNKIILTLSEKMKNNEFGQWYVDEMPPFNFVSVNPWCLCQDEPYVEWDKIEITFIEINQSEAVLTWTWGQSDRSENFNYKVKVTKENDKWKISYLQGFDFVEMTKRNY